MIRGGFPIRELNSAEDTTVDVIQTKNPHWYTMDNQILRAFLCQNSWRFFWLFNRYEMETLIMIEKKIIEAVEKEITELKKYQLEQVHMANNPAVYGEVSPNGHENAEDEIFFLHKILDYVENL